MEILKHNCIGINDIMYDIDQNNPDEKPYIKVFYTSADDIIIAGMIADRGVYWLSVTDAKDESTIRAVFDHVSGIEPKKYADIQAAIANTYYTDEQLKLFHCSLPVTADDIFAYYRKIKDSLSSAGEFGRFAEIQKLNCLIPEKPNYWPNQKFRCIHAHYAENNDVIIVGFADNNYIFWLSVTKMDDYETNHMIIEYLSMIEPSEFGHVSTALDKTNYTYEQFRWLYYTTITRAEDITELYQQAKSRSGGTREDQNKIISKLQKMMGALSNSGNPVQNYHKNYDIFQEIWSLKYLRCSDNPKIREMYHQLEMLSNGIYQDYMTEARGGA